jgi:hypothetical protein
MPSFTYQALTELEAVNQSLSTIGESPISTLEVTGDLNVSVARQMLYDTSREIQTKGFYFNTEINYPLVRTVDNFINIPSNTLSLEMSKDLYYLDVTQRGNRLYDRRNHTFVFDKDLKADLVLFLDWDSLPQPARQYISIVSARRFQRRMLGNDTSEKFTEMEEYMAKAQLGDSDAHARDYNLGDSLDLAPTLWRDHVTY